MQRTGYGRSRPLLGLFGLLTLVSGQAGWAPEALAKKALRPPAGCHGHRADGGHSNCPPTKPGEEDDELNPAMIADVLDGQMLFAPCTQSANTSTCAITAPGAACPAGSSTDLALRGAITTDRTSQVPGTPDSTYRLTVHVQGSAEANVYGTGNSSGTGWAAGGGPASGSKQPVFMIRVTDPKTGNHTDYFLNGAGSASAPAQGVSLVDYTANLDVRGGSSLRLVVSDPDCTISKNCRGNDCSNPVVLGSQVDWRLARKKASEFDFAKPYDGQWLGLSVTTLSLVQ